VHWPPRSKKMHKSAFEFQSSRKNTHAEPLEHIGKSTSSRLQRWEHVSGVANELDESFASSARDEPFVITDTKPESK